MKKDFVVFESPGTFVHETSEKAIDSWDVKKATKMASSISERYGATPFAFYFITRERKDDELDSKVVKTSGRYFLGGTVKTLAEVKAENNPNNRILISNMEGNHWDKIIENCNSWKVTQPLLKNDVVLKYTPPKKKNEKK